MGVTLTLGTDNDIATVSTVTLTGTLASDTLTLQDSTTRVILQSNNQDVILRFSTGTTHGFTLPQTNVTDKSNGPLVLVGPYGGQTLYFDGSSLDVVEVIEE